MATQAGASRDRLSRRPLAADGADAPAPGAGSPGARAWLLFLGGGALLALLYVAMPYGRPAGALEGWP